MKMRVRRRERVRGEGSGGRRSEVAAKQSSGQEHPKAHKHATHL
jgi:hypothetical protein